MILIFVELVLILCKGDLYFYECLGFIDKTHLPESNPKI